jgi:hypothetical protein
VRRGCAHVDAIVEPGLSLGAGGIAAKLEAEPRTDPLPALHRLLELPRETYERTGRRVLVAFDEFHEVLRLEGLDGLIRTELPTLL